MSEIRDSFRETHATLEGLESNWDSPGLGEKNIVFYTPPTMSRGFLFYEEQGEGVRPIKTSRVEQITRIDDDTCGFRTRNTTYLLRKKGIWDVEAFSDVG